MNHLAHLALAGDDALERLGNLAGDFVKGTRESLAADVHPALLRGIEAHREIDRATDQHPVVRRAIDRLPRRRLVNAITVDVLFDHFLHRHWNRFYDLAVSEFIAACYGELRAHRPLLPPRLQQAAPRMIEADWLNRTRTLAGVSAVIDRIARRLRQPQILLGAGAEVAEHADALEADFLAFYPDLIAMRPTGSTT